MKNSSSFKIIFYTIFISLTIFALMKTGNSPKKITNSFISRLLSKKSTEEMCNEMCKKTSDLDKFYSETGPSYTFNPENGDNFVNDMLMKFLNKTHKIDISKDEIVDYSKDNIFYFLILVLFILLILLWIPYCICVFCKKCCCVSESCFNNLKLLLFISILISGGIIIACIIGYTKNSNILNGIFGLGCSILKMEYHLVHGDEYTKETPYWIGLSSIVDKLLSTKDEIQEIGDKSDKILDTLEGTNQLFDEFNTNIKNEWTDKKNKKISSPIPGNDQIIPDYIKNYGSEEDSKKCLGAVKFELDALNSATIPTIKKIVDVVDIKSVTNDTKNNINSIAKELNSTVSKVEKEINKGIGDYYDKFDEIDSLVRRIMNVLFSFNLAIVIAFVVSIFLLLCCKCGTALIAIFWVVIYIFMLASLLLGCVLGITGSFIKDASSAVKNIMNKIDQINSNDKLYLLDICINGNGSLAHTDIVPMSFDTSIVDNIYNLEGNISKGLGIISDYNYLSIKTNDELYNKVLTNPANFVLELKTALEQIKPYINSYVENTKISTDIKDTWVVNKEDCNNDYLPNNKNNLRNLLLEEAQSCCLVITEWSAKDIEDRYKSLEPKDSSIILKDVILNYRNSICQFMEENTALMKEIINKNNDFNAAFIEIKNSEINLLNNITNITTPLRQIYEGNIGNGSIFEIMNCKFIKRDTNKIVEILYNKFGDTFKDTSIIFLVISFCEIILTIFVLTIMKALKAGKTQIPNYSKYSRVQQ